MRRIQEELAEQGHAHDPKTIAGSMQRLQLTPKAARKFKVTTDSNHTLPVAPNLLERNVNPARLNQVWAGDITYLYTTEGWLYLAVMIDLYSRSVIGWSMQRRLLQPEHRQRRHQAVRQVRASACHRVIDALETVANHPKEARCAECLAK